MRHRTAASIVMVVATAAGACGERAAAPAARATTLAVRDAEDIGRYVTDDAGRALYTLGRGHQAACNADCAAAWPAVAGGAAAESAEPAIQHDLVSTIEGLDGRPQLAYGGHPLHYRREAPSAATPDRSVRDRWGTWSLLFPHGERMVP